MKCPKCGRIIDDDSKYCDYCGTKVNDANVSEKSNVSHNKIWSIVTIALVHLASLGIAYSVHWETFAYYGIDYEGYPAAGEYNSIFFACVAVWLVTLILLPIFICTYKRKN